MESRGIETVTMNRNKATRTLMKVEICCYILVHLFACGVAWPRYGRPHPLYNGRQQRNQNIFTNAVLLGLDFNEIQPLQRAFGQWFGFGNLGLLNSGFPMNAYERKRARQDMNILTALGVIDSPEDGGSPDTPDNPGAKNGVGKGTKKSTANGQLKGKRKIMSKTAKNVNTKNSSNVGNKSKLQTEKTTEVFNKGEKQGLRMGNAQSSTKTMIVRTIKDVNERKLANKQRKGRQQNNGGDTDKTINRPGGKRRFNRPKRRRNPPGGNRVAGADSGEDRSEDHPLRGRGGGRALWRNWGEDA